MTRDAARSNQQPITRNSKKVRSPKLRKAESMKGVDKKIDNYVTVSVDHVDKPTLGQRPSSAAVIANFKNSTSKYQSQSSLP